MQQRMPPFLSKSKLKMLKLGSLHAWLGIPCSQAIEGSRLHGWLFKKGNGQWKRRYFVLRNEFMVYYEGVESALPIGAIFLEASGMEVIIGHHLHRLNCFTVSTMDKHYVLSAEESEHSVGDWMEQLALAQYATMDERVNLTNSNGAEKDLLTQLTESFERERQLKAKVRSLERRHCQAVGSMYRADTVPDIRAPSALSKSMSIQQLAARFSSAKLKPQHQGWLYKCGVVACSKKQLWFVLTEYSLFYYRSPTETEPVGVIPLETCSLSHDPSPSCESIDKTTPALYFFTLVHSLSDRTYRLATVSENERTEWIKCLTRAIKASANLVTSDFVLATERGEGQEDFADLARLLVKKEPADRIQQLNTISQIVAHPQHLECYRAFLVQEHSPENLMFYLDVDNLKTNPRVDVRAALNSIFVRYIGEDAPYEVNLPHAIVEGIMKGMASDEPSLNIYDKAHENIASLMCNDSLMRYRRALMTFTL